MKTYGLPLAFVCCLLMSACHYGPFLKYTGTKGVDNFPKFKDKHYHAGSANPLRTAYDITCYDWTVHVFPERKKLEGLMRIHFKATAPADTILIDLQRRMRITKVEGTAPVRRVKHKGDLLYVQFREPLTAGSDYYIDFHYRGKPASILGMGPVFWLKDSEGYPRVSTLTQGIGPHFAMPCKDLLYDEPDSCFIRVSAPNGLTAVANGRLLGTEPLKDRTLWHYAVMNPINVYNISFNIARFCKLEYPYTDIDGVDRTIEAQVLCTDTAKARPFYAQSPLVMGTLEELYGTFPWWEDGCRFVQSAVKGSAMEHQSAISMGDILYYDRYPDSLPKINSTLIHELAHEWWGNSITAYDYGDAWIHEGMATYSEMLAVERIIGLDAYRRLASRPLYEEKKPRPVVKPFGVRYNSWANPRDFNIYSKGAAFMHSIRATMADDSTFFAMLRDATLHFQKSEITTHDLELYFSEYTQRDMSAIFQLYLREIDPPMLQYHLDTARNVFYYRLADYLHDGLKLPLLISDGAEDYTLFPTKNWQQWQNESGAELTMLPHLSAYMRRQKLESPPPLAP